MCVHQTVTISGSIQMGSMSDVIIVPWDTLKIRQACQWAHIYNMLDTVIHQSINVVGLLIVLLHFVGTFLFEEFFVKNFIRKKL